MAASEKIIRRLATARGDTAGRTSGRAAVQIAAVLLWALTTSQVLVVLHSYTHPPAQTSAACGICLLGARVAQVPDVPSEPSEPRTLCVPLATPTDAPYVRPVHRKPSSRAPPLRLSTSAAA